MNAASRVRHLINLTIVLLLLQLFILFPKYAFGISNKTMVIGRSKEIYFSDGARVNGKPITYDAVAVKSSRPDIVKCDLRIERNPDDEDYYYQAPYCMMLFARGFGTSKITMTYWRFITFKEFSARSEYRYYDEDSLDYEYNSQKDDGSLPKKLIGSETFKVTVKGGKIYGSDCDGLLTNKSYSLSSIFRNSLYKIGCDASDRGYYDPDKEWGYNIYYKLTNPTMGKPQKSGKFIKGIGYRVLKGGKRVVFTKSGRVTLRYKAGGRVYKITCCSVHSITKFKTNAVKYIKDDLYVPSSMRVISCKLHYDNEYGNYYYTIKYSAMNIYGVRITTSNNVYMRDGTLTDEEID